MQKSITCHNFEPELQLNNTPDNKWFNITISIHIKKQNDNILIEKIRDLKSKHLLENQRKWIVLWMMAMVSTSE